MCKKLNKFRYYTNINILKIDKNIPKIIHQIAPIDIKKWHPLWKECQETWKLKFPRPEYKYKLWNDEEDLENLIKNDFPFFLKIYKKYSRKIQRIDMARYFILYKYGGIYIDMDFYCYKNFYDKLNKEKLNITCSPFIDIYKCEFLQNSLMASHKNNFIFLNIIDEAIRRHSQSALLDDDISKITGPELISDIYYKLQSFFNPLNRKLYNPILCKDYDNEELYNKNTCYCKHFGTGQWNK